jgi:hypothetical protein
MTYGSPALFAACRDDIESLLSKGLLRMESENAYQLTGRGFELKKTLEGEMG